MEVLSFMLLPFLESLILVGIHSYLGIHVLKRGIIFVDLAIAQVAALGIAVGMAHGIEPGTVGSYCMSLFFALTGALLFSFTRTQRKTLPQEALIGFIYAMASAITLLVLAHASMGKEHLEVLLMGNLLWVQGKDVVKAFLLYAVIGFLHYKFQKPLQAISENPDGAKQSGISLLLWDLFFYGTFAVVITTSVSVAGVLLVFVFLITPSMLGAMTTESFLGQLVIGWSAGTLVTFLGLWFSYLWDLPGSPTVIALYGVVFILWSFSLYVKNHKNTRESLIFFLKVLLGTGIFFGILQGLLHLFSPS